MAEDKTGGPAFPTKPNAHTEPDTPGMTLLDYFAGEAITGLIVTKDQDLTYSEDNLAIDAYSIAEAMIKEREKWV